MALTIKAKRIGRLFRLISGEEKAGLVSRGPVPKRRIKYALVLSRQLAGRNQVIKLRKLVREIEAATQMEFNAGRLSATDVQTISKLAAATYNQLQRADQRRQERSKQLTDVEQKKILTEAQEPFSVARGSIWSRDGFEWQVAIVDGRVAWRLISPIKFEVITRRESDEQTTVADAASEPVESAGPSAG